MAESGKITREDIIAKDAFTSAVEEAKELLKVVTEIQNALKVKAKQSTDGFAIASPQTLDDVAKLTKQIEELKKQILLLEEANKKQKKATEALTQAQAEEILARQKQRREIIEQVKIQSDVTTSYEKQVAALAKIKRQLKELSVEGKQAPEQLLKDFQKLDGSVRKAEESVKEFHRSIGNYSSATAELKDLTKQLIDLERAGQRDTAAFREMRQRAAELKDTIADTKAEIKTMASDTRTIDGLVGSVNLLANAYQVTEGALVLLGENSEEWKETMVKLQAIMAVTSGIQEIQNLLQKESAAMMFLNSVQTKSAAAAQGIYAFATGGATAATKAFRIALLATGVGALVVGIAALAGAFGDLSSSVEDETEKQIASNAALEKAKKITTDYKISITELDVQLAALAGKFEDIKKAEEKLFALKQSKEFGEAVGTAYSNAVKKSKEYQESLKKEAELKGDVESATRLIALNEAKLATETREGFRKGYENGLILNKQRLDAAEKEILNERAKRDKILKNDVEYQAVLKGAIEKRVKEKQLFNAQEIKNDEENAEKRFANELEDIKRRAELIDSERKRELAKEKIRYDDELKKGIKNGENIELINKIHTKNKLDINTKYNEKEAAEFDRIESERKAKEKKEQQEALDLEQEKLSGKIDIINEEEAILLEANKKNYTAIKKAIDEEYNLKADKLEKQKVFDLSNKDLTEKQKKLIEEKYKNDSANLAREKAAELKSINQKEKEDNEKNDRERLEQQRKVQQQVLQGIEQGTKRRSEIIQNGLNAEIKKQDEAVQRQQELAAQGLDNTLAYQEKKREELQAKLEREKEAERRREEALQLAGAFLGSYQSRVDKGQETTAAMAGALADTLIAKAISSTIAGAFAGGVEDFQGKGTGTSDSNLIAFSHGESVVTAKATQQYSGLVTAMNKGLVDDYVKQMILPDMDAPMKSNGNSFQSAAIVYTLTKELGELKQAIKNKQEIKVNWNAQGERVEEIVKDGMKTVIKHVTTGKRRL